ncbi:MAG: 4Fe-4S binding protein [Clostridiales Family XIII bacterium]|jgi:formate hydrogenlyase subunit 6/NADH:ubiquinone oxidoreductase subunit I|nr:4Fe-4S binding protein [Clostridiales Family XIII bacterium]
MANLKIGKMIMRSLFQKPATRMYPIVAREYTERTRGHIAVDMNACILCGICGKKCPTDAITVDRAGKTWSIQRMSCIQCSCCVEVCPKDCLVNETAYTSPDVIKIVDTFEKPEVEAGGGAAAEGSLKCDDTCVFCGICVKKCPQDALTVDRAEKKWEVDDDACTRCGFCVEACPKKSLTIG